MYALDETHSHTSKVSCNACAVSPSGTIVVTGGADGSVKVIRSPDMAVTELKGHNYSVNALVFSPCGQYVISGSADYSVIVWDIKSGSIRAKLMHHKAPVRCLTVSNDGTLLISGAGDQTFAVTNLITCQFTHTLLQNESDAGMLSGVCLAVDNSFVAGVATSGTIFIYDVSVARARCAVYDAHDYGVNACCTTLLNDQHILITVGADSFVKLWRVDNKSATLCRKLSGHSGPVLCCRISGSALYTGSVDKTVILWDIESEGSAMLHQTVCHKGMVNAIDLADNLVVSCSNDMTTRQWRVVTDKRSSQLLETQSKLSKWSVKQVNSWLTLLNLPQNGSYCGADIADTDLDTLVTSLTDDAAVQSKLKRSIMLLRCFEGVPNEFLCPISIEIMTDPVVANDGHSYDRASITEWLSKGNVTSPFTNIQLNNQSLVANHNLRNLIETVFFANK